MPFCANTLGSSVTGCPLTANWRTSNRTVASTLSFSPTPNHTPVAFPDDEETLAWTSLRFGLNPQLGEELAEHQVSCSLIGIESCNCNDVLFTISKQTMWCSNPKYHLQISNVVVYVELILFSCVLVIIVCSGLQNVTNTWDKIHIHQRKVVCMCHTRLGQA